jgi:uncharacterized protein (DUF433 family)
MATEYVQHRDGNIYVGPSRVTIDSVVINWQAGLTPEQIQASFPSLSLAYVYGTIAYYLEHQDEIDAWIHEGEELYEQQRATDQAARPEWYAMMRQRFAEARHRLGLDAEGESNPDPTGPSPSLPTPTIPHE